MTVLDKIKTLFRPKPESKGVEKKPAETPKKKEVRGETRKGGEK